MRRGSVMLALGLIVLTGLGLSGKFRPSKASPEGGRNVVEQSLARGLEARGWRAEGEMALTASGLYRVLAFQSSACDGALYLTAMAPNGEAASMLDLLAGDEGRVVFLHDGRAWDEVPVFRAVLAEKLGRLFGMGPAETALIGVVVTGACASMGEDLAEELPRALVPRG